MTRLDDFLLLQHIKETVEEYSGRVTWTPYIAIFGSQIRAVTSEKPQETDKERIKIVIWFWNIQQHDSDTSAVQCVSDRRKRAK